MKKLSLLAFATLALVACSDNDYLGNGKDLEAPVTTKEILFGAGNQNTTRADKTGTEAALLLNNRFVVNGYKVLGSDLTNVFPLYMVDYTDGTAGTTASNTHGWEYVGINSQEIRYWDYDAAKYVFQAYSTRGNSHLTVTPSYTLAEGGKITVHADSKDDLADLYVADFKTVNPRDYGQVVLITFRNAASRVCFGLYEAVPGYQITDVRFRSGKGNFVPTTANAMLDGSFTSIGGAATDPSDIEITYGADNIPVFTTGASVEISDYFDFGAFNPTNAPLGTTAATATMTSPLKVTPNGDHAAPMTLYIDFTLTSNDGIDVLHIKDARVTVPAQYMVWKPNFYYTYLFKITQTINGTTGQDPEYDLPDGGVPVDPTDPDSPIYYPQNPGDPYNPGTDPIYDPETGWEITPNPDYDPNEPIGPDNRPELPNPNYDPTQPDGPGNKPFVPVDEDGDGDPDTHPDATPKDPEYDLPDGGVPVDPTDPNSPVYYPENPGDPYHPGTDPIYDPETGWEITPNPSFDPDQPVGPGNEPAIPNPGYDPTQPDGPGNYPYVSVDEDGDGKPDTHPDATPEKDPDGLFPITFDAVVVDEAAGNQVIYTVVDGTENSSLTEH